MERTEIEKMLETGYIKPDGDDWYDMSMGTFLGTGIYGAGVVAFMMKFGVPKLYTWIYLCLVLAIIVYLYWKDGQIKTIRTGLTKNENLNLLRGTFNQLNWSTNESSDVILVGDNKYILKFIQGRVFYSDNFIGYNFRYSSTSKTGRPAFFFGVRTYLKSKFEGKLRTFIEQKVC